MRWVSPNRGIGTWPIISPLSGHNRFLVSIIMFIFSEFRGYIRIIRLPDPIPTEVAVPAISIEIKTGDELRIIRDLSHEIARKNDGVAEFVGPEIPPFVELVGSLV